LSADFFLGSHIGPRSPLFLDEDHEQFMDTNGGAVPLTFLRLAAMLRVGPHQLKCEGLFNTGTALTVFPERLWRRFENAVDWLHASPGHRLPAWWTSATGLTGGTFPCRIGRIQLTVWDREKNEICNIPVTGKFLADGGKLRERVLLGLSHSILQGRKIHIDPDRREAWLEDRA
jgi:hypothetical protein